MNVRLLSYSQPTQEFADLGIQDAQELIAYCARVSNPTNHFIELRSANGTQKEHQEVAIACAQVIAEIFPMTTDLVAI